MLDKANTSKKGIISWSVYEKKPVAQVSGILF